MTDERDDRRSITIPGTAVFDRMREPLILFEPSPGDGADDHRCVYANPAFADIAGRSPFYFVGKTLARIRSECALPWLDRCGVALAVRQADSFTYFKPGSDRGVDIRIFPTADEGLFACLIDLPPRGGETSPGGNAEYSVLRSLSKLTRLSEDFLFTLDAGGRFTGVFGKWMEANGYPEDFFIGKSVCEVLGGADAEVKFESELMRAVMNGHAECEWAFHSPARSEPGLLQVIITPVESGGSNFGLLGIGRDITALVRKQRELNAALEAKTVLLQEVLHRVNNNLQLIVSLIELQLGDPVAQDGEQQLKLIKSRVYAMAAVHDSLAAEDGHDRIRLSGLWDKLTCLFGGANEALQNVRIGGFSMDERIILPVEVAIPLSLILHEHVLRISRSAPTPAVRMDVFLSGALLEGERCELTVRDTAADWKSAPDDTSEILIEGLLWQINGVFSDSATGTGHVRSFAFPLAGAGHPRVPTFGA